MPTFDEKYANLVIESTVFAAQNAALCDAKQGILHHKIAHIATYFHALLVNGTLI